MQGEISYSMNKPCWESFICVLGGYASEMTQFHQDFRTRKGKEKKKKKKICTIHDITARKGKR